MGYSWARAPKSRVFVGCVAALTAHAAFAQSRANEAQPQTQGAKAPVRVFDIEAYDVDGAKLLQQVEVETAVYPYLGPGRTAADVEKARMALERAYRDRGYQSVVVEVPAQSVSDNIVRLHVVEAPVGRLRVTGSRYFSPEVIRHEAAAFQEGQVPNITEAQSELTEINRLPDRRVTPVLRAGVAPGTVDVDLKVNDTLPLHGSLELNNDHNQYTDPLRLLGTIHYDDLWQLGHSASFTYVTAPQNIENSQVFAGSYLAPIWNSPFSILGYGYDSNSNVATLGGTTVLGKGYALGVRSILQLPSRGDLSQSVSFGFDYKNFAEDINFSQTNAVVQYWPMNLVYNIQKDSTNLSTKVSLGVTAGIRGLGDSEPVFQYTRFDATPSFIHINLDLTQTETFAGGFVAAQHVTGQLTDQPLVSSEEFSAGGLTSVRGYLQSEAVGDQGVSGSLELRTPSEPPHFAPFVDELRLYVFTDGAVVRVLDPLAGQSNMFELASAGLGLRIGVLKHLKGDIVVAVPFLSGVATHADTPRTTFSLKSEF